MLKDREFPESNFSEVIHFSWMKTKRKHVTLYETTTNDKAVTIKGTVMQVI